MVEDHPYDYKDFEGVIPEGNYGAGTVMIWDQGTYSVPDTATRVEGEDRVREGLKKGHITFILNGAKLHGEFALVKLKRSKEPNAWLIIKANDRFATSENILNKIKSAVSGKNMGEIKSQMEGLWFSDDGKIDLSKTPSSDIPKVVRPMLATLVDKPFSKEGWLFEIKWDGYRAITQIKDKNVLIYSRNGKSFNDKFAVLVQAFHYFPHDVIFDGEVVVFDKKEKPNFNLVQNYPETGGTLIYYIFDLIFLDGHLLENQALWFRRRVLKEIIPQTEFIRLSDGIEREGEEFFEAIKKQGLEGMIAKDMKSSYEEGIRSKNWLKIKTHLWQEAIIAGYTEGQGNRSTLGSLVMAVYDDKKLKYIGNVGTGFSEKDIRYLLEQLKSLEIEKTTLEHPPKLKAVHWVHPVLVCEIKFQEITPDGLVRQGVFLGLREDKSPKEIELEKPIQIGENA